MTKDVRRLVAPLALCAALAGCGGGSASGDASDAPDTSPPSATASQTTETSTESPSASTRSEDGSKEGSEKRATNLRGIDVSHHQGAIDWPRVAADGIDFAYLKATEGSGFTDDRFATNAREARAAGLRVGAYHYYTLCARPEAQADHFVATLQPARTNLPPVVDLELIGNCDPPPVKAGLRADVVTFIERVEAATGTKIVVYFHPDFEAHYALVADLDRRLWVRRVGTKAPPGDWVIWQRDDHGSVDGVDTPVDVDVMRR
ncbi:glycoside hydrolase family 25 protein [Nocardioides sp. Soil796]|uniref:glycoside hydrolase family 25 protein n=1 Tax=Nocardioides sp. Soil796 TaxID=1736412 RepID=UPI0009E6E79E|nr:GH25 family lysozyme [Nocardioides sp. Soil796]